MVSNIHDSFAISMRILINKQNDGVGEISKYRLIYIYIYNFDYKIIMYIISNRFSQVTPSILSPLQGGFERSKTYYKENTRYFPLRSLLKKL